MTSPLAEPPLCAGPDPRPVTPSFTLPHGATDCHFHIFGPKAQFAYAADRIYTPPDALLPAWQQLTNTLGVERGVIVQPSVYETDNTVTLRALEAMRETWRAVVVADDVTDRELERMHALGVRGVRFNVVDVATDRGKLPMEAVRRLADRVQPLGWHVQFLMHVDEYPALEKMFESFPTEIVIDHFGYMKASKGVGDPGF